MKVSVIIPAYNEEHYIGRCLESLLNQEVPADEIIVVNNNSSDKTAEVVGKYAGVTLVNEPRQGTIFARDTAYNTAKNEIIARCDADTIIPRDWIKKIKQHFETKSIDALSGPVSFYDGFINSSWPTILFFDFVRLIQGYETLTGPNMTITKNVWNKIKNLTCHDPTKVHEDMDIAIHIAEVGGKIDRDNSLVVPCSARRINKNPLSFFVEYPIRLVKTYQQHPKKN